MAHDARKTVVGAIDQIGLSFKAYNIYGSCVARLHMLANARIKKVLSEGSNFDGFFSFLLDERISGVIIGPPAKRHFNGVSLACR